MEALNIIAMNMIWLQVPTQWLTIIHKLIFKGPNTFLSTFLEPKRSIQREIRKISIFTVTPKHKAPREKLMKVKETMVKYTTLKKVKIKGSSNSLIDIHVHDL